MALTFTDSSIDTANGSSYSFSSLSFGTAGASRVMVCAVFGGGTSGARTVSALTIGGVSATHAVRLTDIANFIKPEIWYAEVPTGTSGTVAVTWTGGNVSECGVGLWRIDEGIFSVADTDEVSDSNPAANSLSVVAGDYIIGCGGSSSSPTATNWNGVTERFYENGGARDYAGADATAASTDASYSLQVTWTSGANESLVSAAFRPSASGAATGTVAVSGSSAPTKESTAAVTGTSAVAGISQATKTAVGASAGTSAVLGVMGALGAATGAGMVAATGQATKQSTAAVTGTVSVQEPASEATKESVGAASGSSVVSAELEGFKLFQINPVGTATVDGVAGFIGAATGTVALVGDSAATKLATFTEAGTSVVQEPASQAQKFSTNAIAGTSVVQEPASLATKASTYTVTGASTQAAVGGDAEALKASVAAVSENVGVVLGVGTSKLSIHPKAVLNDVSDPSEVTLHDLPDPVPLTIV